MGAAHETMRRRWSGVLQLGDDALPVALDASGERITLSVAGATTDLVMSHVQPAMVAGHANMAIDHPLAPVGALCHLDAVPVGDDGEAGDDAAGTQIVGALTMAQYPGGGRPRQGDAVTAGLHLYAD